MPGSVRDELLPSIEALRGNGGPEEQGLNEEDGEGGRYVAPDIEWTVATGGGADHDVTDEEWTDDDETQAGARTEAPAEATRAEDTSAMRLSRRIARSGIASRREAER